MSALQEPEAHDCGDDFAMVLGQMTLTWGIDRDGQTDVMFFLDEGAQELKLSQLVGALEGVKFQLQFGGMMSRLQDHDE